MLRRPNSFPRRLSSTPLLRKAVYAEISVSIREDEFPTSPFVFFIVQMQNEKLSELLLLLRLITAFRASAFVQCDVPFLLAVATSTVFARRVSVVVVFEHLFHEYAFFAVNFLKRDIFRYYGCPNQMPRCILNEPSPAALSVKWSEYLFA